MDDIRFIYLLQNQELIPSLSDEELRDYRNKIKDHKESKRKSDLRQLGLFDLEEYKPYPIQEKFHRDDSKVRIFLGGNYTGKTLAGACELAWWHKRCHPSKNFINKKDYPLHSLVICVDHKQQKLPGAAQDKLLSLFKEDEIRKIAYNKHNAVDTIFLANGDTITFKSALARRDTIQGARVSAVWIDEDAIPSPNYFDELQTRLPQDGDRLYIWFTMTPNLKEGASWSTEFLFPRANKVDSNIRLWEATIHDNPYISEQAKSDLVNGLVGDDQQVNARLLGNWKVKRGLIYHFDMKKHMIPSLPPASIEDFKSIFRVIDPHNAKPIAVLFAGVDKENRIIVFDELYQQGLVSNVAEWIKAKTKGIEHLVEGTIIDYSGKAKNKVEGRSIYDEFRRCGIHCKPCIKDVKGGIEVVKKLLYFDESQGIVPKLYVTANCVNTIREFKSYQWEPESVKNNDQKPMKRNDEFMDSIRYLACDPMFRIYLEGKVRNSNFKGVDLDEISNTISTKNARIKRRMSMLGEGVGRDRVDRSLNGS